MARTRKSQTKTTSAAQEEVTTDVTSIDAGADMAAIEALLNGDAEFALDEAPEAAEEELIAAVAGEIEAADAKDAAYEAAESEVDTAPLPEGVKAKAPAKPRAAKLPFEDAVKAFHAEEALTLDAEVGPMTETQVGDMISSVTQIKVKEKVLNMLGNVMHDRPLMKFTGIALNVLKQGYLDGTPITSAQFRKAYEDAGYKSGTANAQAGQMMSLFPALQLATRTDRSTLTANANSVLLEAYCA